MEEAESRLTQLLGEPPSTSEAEDAEPCTDVIPQSAPQLPPPKDHRTTVQMTSAEMSTLERLLCGMGESSSSGSPVEARLCAQCGLPIADRYLLKAMDKFWHEDCLKCGCCGCRLAEAGSSMFSKQGMLLCKRDYLRLFGMTGMCAACQKQIPAFEMVMRARANVYHLECFACQECAHRFCVGDKFYLCEGKILCEYDYEERLVFAQMAYNFNSIAHLKRQFQDDDMSQEVGQVVQAVPSR